MARYYDLDKLSEMIQAKADTLIEGKEAFLYVAKWLDLLPPADVAPKSEVERLQSEVTTLMNDYAVAMLKYENAKTEVAREIFEEIENWFELYSEREYSFAEEETAKEHYPEAEAHDYALDIIKDLRQLCVAQLKKKYTEGKE